jgi:hypothetical protein
MRKIRTTLIAGALTALVLAIAPAASGASGPKERCVGDPPCFATLQKAVDAARAGDVIRIEPGTFSGGVTIDKSVKVVGSGASRTIIKGGGPVLTIGKAFAQSEPKVTISKVKITGGRTTSSPLSKEFVGKKNVIALGGGIAIPPGKFIKSKERFAFGAKVKVIGSVITGNRVGPSATAPFGPPCPGGPCPFAAAGGGGIDNWGALTLERTKVSNNLAAGVGSDSIGGGIDSDQGSLDLRESTITSNRAIASVPNGRYAEGGGIFTGSGLSGEAPVAVRIRGGAISENEASLTSKLPYFVGDGKGSTIDMNANGGGAHFGGGSAISIAHTRVDENEVGVDDPKGEPYAFDSAIHFSEGSTIDLSHSTIEDNEVRAKVGSSEHAGPSGSAIDLAGPSRGGPGPHTVSHVRITGNTTLVTSEDGDAEATGGAIYIGAATRITHSVISGNRLKALSAKGSASVLGGGVLNDGAHLMLQDVLIEDNHGIAIGPEGFARGGGIWNGRLFLKQPPHLTLEHTRVIGNTLRASPGLPVKGGGIFSAFPVTLNHSKIAHNVPDQCFGC